MDIGSKRTAQCMAREAGKISTTPSIITGGRTGIPAAAGSCKACYINLVNECANPALRAFSTAWNDREADYIHCSRFNQRRVESYQFDAATSATGYTSEDYSDAARQLSGQAHGGAGKSDEPTFNSTEFYLTRDFYPTSLDCYDVGSSPRVGMILYHIKTLKQRQWVSFAANQLRWG